MNTSAPAQVTRSPWCFSRRVRMLAWEWTWALLCSWTPKPCNGWRLLWLRLFGARVSGNPFVHQRARILMPWNIVLRNRSCIGDRANLYSLESIDVGEEAIIAQEVYLCTGTHVFQDVDMPLALEGIRIGRRAFLGARVFVLPGITIGDGAIVGACSVVTRDVQAFTRNAGNPCRCIAPGS